MTEPATIDQTSIDAVAESLVGGGFPDSVWVVVVGYLQTGGVVTYVQYACYFVTRLRLHGLACFTSPEALQQFCEMVGIPGQPQLATFDQAIAIAQSRPPHVTCLLLLDDPSDPEVFHVR